MELQELKDSVVKLLITQYDFLPEEAEASVGESFADDPELWGEDASAESLANSLATDEDDD